MSGINDVIAKVALNRLSEVMGGRHFEKFEITDAEKEKVRAYAAERADGRAKNHPFASKLVDSLNYDEVEMLRNYFEEY